MANGHDDTLMKRVESYGKGDPGVIGMIPMMSMVALKVIKVTETGGGLALPANMQQDYQTPKCVVLAVGPQVMFTKVGDHIFIPGETIASKLFVGDANFVMIREDQIFARDIDSVNSHYIKEATRNKIAAVPVGKLVTEG